MNTIEQLQRGIWNGQDTIGEAVDETTRLNRRVNWHVRRDDYKQAVTTGQPLQKLINELALWMDRHNLKAVETDRARFVCENSVSGHAVELPDLVGEIDDTLALYEAEAYDETNLVGLLQRIRELLA